MRCTKFNFIRQFFSNLKFSPSIFPFLHRYHDRHYLSNSLLNILGSNNTFPKDNPQIFVSLITLISFTILYVSGFVYRLKMPEFKSGFNGVCVVQSSVFWVVFCKSLFVIFLLVIVLSVVRFTAVDIPFDILKPLLIIDICIVNLYIGYHCYSHILALVEGLQQDETSLRLL